MDIKKWLSKKENRKDINFFRKESKMYKFLDKEGFYVILFLCVCIVATSAVWVTKTNIDRLAVEDLNKPSLPEEQALSIGELQDNDRPYEEMPVVIVEEAEQTEKIAPVAAPAEERIVAKTENKPQPSKKTNIAKKEMTAVQPVASAARAAMGMPAMGKTGMAYAAETLVYSKTLEQYSTHHGIDILGQENDPVVAALDGEVVEIYEDPRLGITIVLEHEGDMLTKYSNLRVGSMVEVGDQVEKGQIISEIGSSALFESMEEPHLHFEVLMDGVHVDPNQYLPKNE